MNPSGRGERLALGHAPAQHAPFKPLAACATVQSVSRSVIDVPMREGFVND